jgi:Flp pilus assembly protein TadD
MMGWLRGFWQSHRRRSTGSNVDKSPSAVLMDPKLESMIGRAESLALGGDLAGAAACIEDALAHIPDSAHAHRVAANIRLGMRDEEAALDHFTLAAHFAPNDWESTRGRAGILERRGDTARAVSTLEAFLARNPLHEGGAVVLARLQYAHRAHDDAVATLRARLCVFPEDTNALNVLGLILAREFGDLVAGGKLLERALELAPGLDEAASNLGWVYAEQGRVAEALAHFNAVLTRHPHDNETRLMRAYTFLKNGDFAAGWRDFDARHASPLAIQQKRLVEPCLPGQSLAGKRVFLRAEQGLGDQIMFVSCLKELVALGTNCVLECDDRLVGLFRRSFPDVEVVGAGAEDGWERLHPRTVDCELDMGDLPGIFRRSQSDFPVHSGYLRADPARVAYWQDRLASLGEGPVVGLSWLGGAPSTRRQLRSIPLEGWRGLLGQRGQYVSLQYGNCAAEVEAFERQSGLRVWHWPDVMADYDDTAALVTALDLVVSVCTAVVHLCGALGKEAWVLTPATPEWRYQFAGERLPWYPSVRLFRQSPGEGWEPVVERAASAYAQRLKVR